MNGQEWQDIRGGRLSPMPNTGEDMVNIIQQMMDPVSANRPTPLQLLQHPLLLSEEQKALNAAKSRVMQANMQLAIQQQQFQRLAPPVIIIAVVRLRKTNKRLHSLYQLLVCILLSSLARSARNLNI
jgi:hypothetical protein